MAREEGHSAGSRDRSERPGALSASRTLLVVARRPASLAEAFQDRGLPTTFAKSAAAAVYWVRQQPPAIVLLDMNVERAGFLMQQFRAEGRTVIAMSDDTAARTRALEAGCLDAIPMSIPLEELALKIAKAVQDRRARRVGTIIAPPLLVDLSAQRLLWRGAPVSASSVLVHFAACLASRPGQIVSTRVLLGEVWGEPWASRDRVHRTAWRLRRTLGLSRDDGFVSSRWREGYGIFPSQEVGRGSIAAVPDQDV